jgi:hypothetical protein
VNEYVSNPYLSLYNLKQSVEKLWNILYFVIEQGVKDMSDVELGVVELVHAECSSDY